MKVTSTLTLLGLCIAASTMAQNQITTPSGQPLVIGNNGVRLFNLNSNTAPGTSNGKVLTVDQNGLLFLAPDQGGGGPWTTEGNDVHFSSGNVGIGTATPLQRLHVNGDINIPAGSAIRIDNVPFIRTPGTGNMFFGNNSGSSSISGINNIHIGSSAGSANNGSNNIFIGAEAGKVNAGSSSNTFIGWTSGKANTSGFYNTFIGPAAGQANTEANYNTFIGPNAGFNNTTGAYNMFIGVSAGMDNIIGDRNLYLGYNAGRYSLGSNNAFLGSQAGQNTTSGSSNTFIGVDAGIANTSGYNNTAIGSYANFGSGELSNATAIGSHATVTQSNSIILGNPTATVGIGNTAPTAKFHVKAGGTIATGVRFENLPTTNGSIYGLYVDADGNIMRSNSAAGAREAVAGGAENWTLTTTNHLVNTNAGGVMIGSGFSSTPEGYKLYVSEGILTERVKVAVKNTAEWRDNVFQDEYKLRSVEEVEAFIKQNRHLPGVPSAQEMVETGNDLQKTDAILLEKVEEMMLYIIDLKKQNTKLQNENKEQQQAIQTLIQKMQNLEKK